MSSAAASTTPMLAGMDTVTKATAVPGTQMHAGDDNDNGYPCLLRRYAVMLNDDDGKGF